MRNYRTLAVFASLLAGSVLLAAPAVADEWHGAPHSGAPHGAPPGGGPSGGSSGPAHPSPMYRAAPIHGSAPGHVFAMPNGGSRFRSNPNFHGGATAHRFVFQHHDFAHFTPGERAQWTGGWWHHGQWHGRWGWWWFAGGDWFWYDQPIYPYPTYVSETYYDEPTNDEGDSGYWYYCQNPPGYYPYVRYCNGPWQPVAPTPPPGYGQNDQGPDDEQGPPPGYQGGDQGPPPGYQGGEQGPPPGYQGGDQGPPPGYQGGNQSPPPGYQDQGPPPGYQDQGPPHQ